MTAIDQDWVRDAIERHSDASGGNGRDFHNGAYAAIADEIAATLGDEGVGRSNDGVAELGAGTCEMEYVSDWMSWHCKSCDHMDMAPRNPKPRYCKWCGRKVVEPTTNDVGAEVDDG